MLCSLASSEDGAPLPYAVEEIARKLKRHEDATRRAAEEAAASGFLELDGEAMILTDPRLLPSYPEPAAMRFDLILRRLDAELGERGYPYEVWLGDELVVKSHDPEFAACRRLLRSGRLGLARFWREGEPAPYIEMDIAKSAKWRAKETQRKAPHFVAFEEFPAERIRSTFAIKKPPIGAEMRREAMAAAWAA